MNPLQLLEQVRASGIALSARDGKLCYEAPMGRMTPELKERLRAHKTALVALLSLGQRSSHAVVKCADCVHHIPAAPVHRPSGALWEMPGGCTLGRTSPDSKPPMFPCTGWYCNQWELAHPAAIGPEVKES